MHGAHVGAEDTAFLHGEVNHQKQQADNRKERVKHRGQTEFPAENAQTFVIQIETEQAKRNTQEKQETDTLYDAAACCIL